MCIDSAGESHLCNQGLFYQADGVNSDCDTCGACSCPCDDGDCNEHEIRLDPVWVESTKVPSQTCYVLPYEFANFSCSEITDLSMSHLIWQSLAENSTDPVFHLRKVLMIGVIMRL